MRLFIAIVPDNEAAGRIAELRDDVSNESLRKLPLFLIDFPSLHSLSHSTGPVLSAMRMEM